jgi:hypothetical protein
VGSFVSREASEWGFDQGPCHSHPEPNLSHQTGEALPSLGGVRSRWAEAGLSAECPISSLLPKTAQAWRSVRHWFLGKREAEGVCARAALHGTLILPRLFSYRRRGEKMALVSVLKQMDEQSTTTSTSATFLGTGMAHLVESPIVSSEWKVHSVTRAAFPEHALSYL